MNTLENNSVFCSLKTLKHLEYFYKALSIYLGKGAMYTVHVTHQLCADLPGSDVE